MKYVFLLIHFLYILIGFVVIKLFSLDNGIFLWYFWGAIFFTPLIFENMNKHERDVFSPLHILLIALFLVFWVGAIKFIYFDQVDASKYIYYAYLSYNFFCIGYFLSKGKLKKRNDIKLNSINRQLIVWSSLLISIMAAVYLVLKVGVPALYNDKFSDKFEARGMVSSYVIYLIRIAQFSVYFSLANALVGDVKLKKNLYFSSKLWFAICILVTALIINFLPGWRGPLILLLFSCLLLWHYLYKKLSLKLLALSVSLGLLLVFGWGFWRIVSSIDGLSTLSYLDTDQNSVKLFVDWVSYQFSAYFLGFIAVIDNISNIGHLGLGGVYKMTLTTILPGKQETFGEILKNYVGFSYRGGGLNPTIAGESYADLGLLSLSGYMAFWGWFIGVIYKNMIINKRVSDVLLYSYLLPVLTIGVFTGVFAQASYSFHFIILLIMISFMKIRLVSVCKPSEK